MNVVVTSLSTSPFLLDNMKGEESRTRMGRWADKKSLQMNEHLFAQILFAVPSIHPSQFSLAASDDY